MGRLKAKTDYESIRTARIIENQARLSSMGVQKMNFDLRSFYLSEKLRKTPARKNQKVDYASGPRRRSARLNGLSDESSLQETSKSPHKGEDMKPEISSSIFNLHCQCKSKENSDDSDGGSSCQLCSQMTSVDFKEGSTLDMDEPYSCRGESAGMLRTDADYESIRNARIMENRARLASLGLHKTLSELRSKTPGRKNRKVDYSCSPRRYSPRLKGIAHTTISYQQLEIEENLLENMSVVRFKGRKPPGLSPEVLDRRCASQSRGSIYHPVYGICCHFCRQKKMCGEEDCKRCGDLDIEQPCIGKTDCSVCHSSNGILCRACLKVRYGEEMDEVRKNKQWMCPHCIEDKGVNPYWICNSSLCLKKRHIAPTGIAIFKAREMGYKSVAHLLMDELQRKVHR